MNDAQEAGALAGFEGTGETDLTTREAGTVAVAAREEAELKSAIFLARQFPRDDARAYTRMMNSCKRAGFAEDALYSFPRGGSTVKGPSVQMAREFARLWGNIRTGLRVVSLDADSVHIRGYAHDLETNAYVEHEDKFARLIQRKRNGRTQWVPPDERDLRELINKRGAILVRNAILQVAPSDVLAASVRQVEETRHKAAEGEIEQSRDDAIRRLAVAFDAIGVNTDALEGHLGHPLESISAEEIADLRGVYKSIVDGNSRRDEHFDLGAGRKVRTESNEELNARLAGEDTEPFPELESEEQQSLET